MPRKKGRRISFNKYSIAIFQLNEYLYEKGLDMEEHGRRTRSQDERPRTDNQILHLLAIRFPDHYLTKLMLSRPARSTVNEFRGRFNRGELHISPARNGVKHFTTPPAFISFRYNREGQRVEGRKGKRRLTTEEQTQTIQTFLEKRKAKLKLLDEKLYAPVKLEEIMVQLRSVPTTSAS